MPLISIIMPVYKVEAYITNSVCSVRNQTFRDFELILVDDGSPDDSIALAEKELINTSVEYRIISKNNQGVASARNLGIASAKGEWIICIDPDDEIHPKTLEILSKIILKEPDTPVFGINFQVVHDSIITEYCDVSNNNYRVYEKEDIADAFFLRKVKLIAPGLLIRKSFLEMHRVTYDADVRYSEDQLYIWQLIANAKSVGFVEEKLYYYLTRPFSTMTSSKEEKILTGYRGFKLLNEQVSSEEKQLGKYGDLILPRWVFGVLHSSAKYMKYVEIKHLADTMMYKKHMQMLYRSPDKLTVLMARVSMLSRYLFYLIARTL